MNSISRLISSKLLEIKRLNSEIDIAYRELINTFKIGEEINVYFNELDENMNITGLPVKRTVEALIRENGEYLIGITSGMNDAHKIRFISPLQVIKSSEDTIKVENITTDMVRAQKFTTSNT